MVDAWERCWPDQVRRGLQIETQVVGSVQVRMDANALVVVSDQLLKKDPVHGASNRAVKPMVECPDETVNRSLTLSSLYHHAVVDQPIINCWLKPFDRGGCQSDVVGVERPDQGLALGLQPVEGWAGVLKISQPELVRTATGRGRR